MVDSARARRGLTLVEVLAVVVILGLIAGTLTYTFSGQMSTAKRNLAKTGIGVVVDGIERYALDQGRIPTMEEGLQVLVETRTRSGDPYLKRDKLIDPWGSPYQYVTPGPESAYQVISLGADRVLGGEAGSDAEDLTSDSLLETDGGSAP